MWVVLLRWQKTDSNSERLVRHRVVTSDQKLGNTEIKSPVSFSSKVVSGLVEIAGELVDKV